MLCHIMRLTTGIWCQPRTPKALYHVREDSAQRLLSPTLLSDKPTFRAAVESLQFALYTVVVTDIEIKSQLVRQHDLSRGNTSLFLS